MGAAISNGPLTTAPRTHRRWRPWQSPQPSSSPWSLLAALFLPALFGYLHYRHVSTLHENRSHFSHLSALERELHFRTEMGFYYSYYKQMVEAPTFTDGIGELLADDLTEFPDTINALGRFNLYPEIVTAALYRTYMSVVEPKKECYRINRGEGRAPVRSCVGPSEPACFYCTVVFALSGLSVAGLCLLARHAAGGYDGAALLTAAGYFFHHTEATRVMWTPPLRESFAVPFLAWQQLAVIRALEASQPTTGPAASPRRASVALTVATLLFLLPWQFSQFVVALQGCAVFGTYLLGAMDAPTLRRVTASFLAAGVLSSALQMGNAMLVTGILPATLLSTLVLSFARLDRRGLLTRVPLGGALLAGLVPVTKLCLTALSGQAGGNDDSHVWDLLRAKFDPGHQTFDTMLYLCSPEFGFLQPATLVSLSKGLILPMAAAVAVMVVRRSSSSKPSSAKTGSSLPERALPNQQAPVIFLLLEVGAFAVLAGLIMRLKVLFVPQLIVTASLLLHERLCPVPIRFRHALAVVLLAAMAVRGIPSLCSERRIVGEYSNYGLEEVVLWIRRHTAPTDAFVGPMTIMATVRATTFRPTYNHPHYEDRNLRDRTRRAYSLYSRKPLEEVGRIHRDEIGARYVIAERHYCFKGRKRAGCRYGDMWDVEDPGNKGNETHFCNALYGNGQGEQRGELLEPYFRKVFENGEFTILETIDIEATDVAAIPSIPAITGDVTAPVPPGATCSRPRRHCPCETRCASNNTSSLLDASSSCCK